MTDPIPRTMTSLQAQAHGEPEKVLRLAQVPVPDTKPGRIRVKVHACALNPADWAVCRGFLQLPPPFGIGLDVSGIVESIGDGVTDVSIGDRVFGVPDFRAYPTAGASDYAVLAVWVPVPQGLDLTEAAALPMAVETATRSIDLLGLKSGQSILVNGGGTMTGFAAVQIALDRGATVIATAGDTFASRLQDLGAKVTPYGKGMVQRVRALAGGAPDFALHTAQVNGVLPDLVAIVDGDPRRVMSFSDFDEAGLGVKTTGREENGVPRYDALGPAARRAAQGHFTIPIAETFPLAKWLDAAKLSMSGHAHGKLVLLLEGAT